MIEAKEINFAYRRGIPVLFDINCKIEDGEFVALLGHNGSGKTTLSRLFMALDHPRSGQILVDGEDIINYEPADLADKVGYVFQNPDLQILADTVYEEVAYGPRVKKLPEENIKTNVKAALQAMGLKELEAKYPRILSFGQKRRLGVAAALALNPRMLILDEITNGQDAAEQAAMMEYLKALNEEKGTAWCSAVRRKNCLRETSRWNAGACDVLLFPNWLPVWGFLPHPVKNFARKSGKGALLYETERLYLDYRNAGGYSLGVYSAAGSRSDDSCVTVSTSVVF